MASDYFNLPAWETPQEFAPMEMQDFETNDFMSNVPAYEPSPYDNASVESEPTYVPTQNVAEDDGLWGGLWNWAKSDMGVSVLGGAFSGGFNMWQQERARDYANANKKTSSGGGGGKVQARINRHNDSFSTGMPMNVRKFKK